MTTNTLQWSLSAIGRRPFPGKPVENGITLEDITWRNAAQDLIQSMLQSNQSFSADVSAPHVKWYFKWIAARSARIAPDLREQIGLGQNLQSGDNAEEIKMFKILKEVALAVHSVEYVSIDNIVNHLKTVDGLLIPVPQERHVTQLAFILLGMFSFLYQPKLHPRPDLLQISFEQFGTEMGTEPTATWQCSERPLDESMNPVVDLLCRYGGPKGPLPDYAITVPRSGSVLDQRPIVALNIGYYTLKNLVRVRVVWTEDVCEHLDLDPSLKVLKLFQVPSYCAMLCAGNDGPTFLSRLFNNYLFDGPRKSSDLSRTINPADFFRELICTYRLMFGQDKDSWQTFVSEYCGTAFWPRDVSGWDPLLLDVCGKECSKVNIYRDIGAPLVKTSYSAETDYPFYGEKLLLLQHFAVAESPNNIWILWRDRKDFRFWGLMIVISTLILTLLQTILSAGQLSGRL